MVLLASTEPIEQTRSRNCLRSSERYVSSFAAPIQNPRGSRGDLRVFPGALRTPEPAGNLSLFVVFEVRAGDVAGKGTKKDVASSESAYLAKGSYCANWNCKIANWTCSRTDPLSLAFPP